MDQSKGSARNLDLALPFTFPESLGQECLLRFDAGKLNCLSKVAGSVVELTQLRFERAQDRVKQVIGLQLRPVSNRSDRFNPGSGPFQMCNGDGAVQGDDRGAGEAGEQANDQPGPAGDYAPG